MFSVVVLPCSFYSFLFCSRYLLVWPVFQFTTTLYIIVCMYLCACACVCTRARFHVGM